MIVNQKKVAHLLQISGETLTLPQVKEFNNLGVSFLSEGKMERKINKL